MTSSRTTNRIIKSAYQPRKWQLRIHEDRHRFVVAAAHRRFGKSYCMSAHTVNKALKLKRRNMKLAPPRYLFLAPTSDAAKDIGFEPCRAFLGDYPHKVKETKPYEIRFPSSAVPGVECRISFIGAFNLNMYRGRHLDGVVADEFGEMPMLDWRAVLLPMLSDYRGWLKVIGTPRGRNRFYHLFRDAQESPEWGTHYYPASKTGYINKEELAFQKKQMGDELYRQEFELEWMAAVAGSYYGKLLSKAQAAERVTNVPHDPNLLCTTAWDLGIDDATAVWVVQRPPSGQTRVIDHYEVSNIGLEHVVEKVKVWKDREGRSYKYQRHYLPHDLGNRSPWTGNKDLETSFRRELQGFGHVQIVPKLPIEDGINAVRRMLPTCWFDEQNCKVGLDHLSLYRQKIDDKLNFSKGPRKDETTHSADAFRYMAVGLPFGMTSKSQKPDEKAGNQDYLNDTDISTADIMRLRGIKNPYHVRHHLPPQ